MSQSLQKKQKAQGDVILIDEEDDVSHRKRDYPLPGVAQRIFKKQTLPSGQVKYLVKWQGYPEDDATWETEQILREKHNELIQDYEYYVLTGERLEEANAVAQPNKPQSASKSESEDKKQKLTSKRAIKRAGRSVQDYKKDDHQSSEEEKKRRIFISESPAEGDSKKNKVIQKQVDKHKKVTLLPFEDFNVGVKSSILQFDSDMHEMIQRQYHQLNMLNSQFIQSSSNILNNLKSNTSDTIESVRLSKTSDITQRLIYTIDWKVRSNGESPYSEYYSYQQMSQLCPLLVLKFLESELIGVQDDLLKIKFSCQGQNEEERHQLIFQAINPKKIAKDETFKSIIPDPFESSMVLVEQEDPEPPRTIITNNDSNIIPQSLSQEVQQEIEAAQGDNEPNNQPIQEEAQPILEVAQPIQEPQNIQTNEEQEDQTVIAVCAQAIPLSNGDIITADKSDIVIAIDIPEESKQSAQDRQDSDMEIEMDASQQVQIQ